MILDEIVANKRKELTRRQTRIPLSTLIAQAKAQPKPLCFFDALRGDQPALIAEVKRASPSRGEIAPQLDPVKLALTYAKHGARVISVLTDERFFHGSLADLSAVKQALLRTGWKIPVLRKDFILSPYQVYEARAGGADAVLLIVAILAKARLAALIAETHRLGMVALVEVHGEQELKRVLPLHPRVIGINRRDLRDFRVDPDVFARLRPLIPPEVRVVAESGVRRGTDVKQLWEQGADAVLVGEALVSATDVGAKVEELCAGGREMIRVKICGITCVEDGIAAAEAGADLLGFVFYPLSPRFIPPRRAARIISTVRRAGYAVQFVGVFVDEDESYIQEVAARCQLDHVQLHGSEPPGVVTHLVHNGLSVIKAVRVVGRESLRELRCYAPSLYLLDSYVSRTPGGSGKAFDWRITREVAGLDPFLLAGGLTPDNVAVAVHTVRPWGVDVSTGVERVPGRKDHGKMRRFVTAAKRPERRRDES